MKNALAAIFFLCILSAAGDTFHFKASSDVLMSVSRFSTQMSGEMQLDPIALTGSWALSSNLFVWSMGIKYYFDFLRLKYAPSINIYAGKCSYYEIEVDYPPAITTINIWGYAEYDTPQEIINGTLWCVGSKLSTDIYIDRNNYFYFSPFLGYCCRSGLPQEKLDYLRKRGMNVNINDGYVPFYVGISFGVILPKHR
jgi:hypothetical protein